MSDLGPRSFRLTALGLLLGASLLVALPALNGEALGHDDQSLLAGPDGALERAPLSFFSDLYFYAYLPFYGLSYWIDGVLGASVAKPLLFHVGNVFWHAATCYLVFCVLALLLRHRVAALLGALLFAVHPLHVESVAWIAGRKDVVSGFFFFLAWLFALRAEERRPRARVWAIVFFLVACFAKASAVVLPLLLLCAAALLPRYAARRKDAMLATVPLFVAAIVPVAVHLAVGFDKGVLSDALGLGDRFPAWIAGWGSAVQRTLFPFDLALDYPGVAEPGTLALAAASLALVACGAAVVALRRRAPAAAFGIAAFFAALLPFNNVFPATDVLAADRYLYLPLFGAAAILAWAAAAWRNGPVAAVVIVLVCAALACVSSSRFTSDEELWTRTIAARDGSALAYINRGVSRAERAMSRTPHDGALQRQAIEDLRAGLARTSKRALEARASAALVLPLVEQGEMAEALERAGRAMELVPDEGRTPERLFRAKALHHRGIAHKARGASGAAAADFSASARLYSRYAAWYEAGIAYQRSGDAKNARKALEKAGALDRTKPDAHLNLALLFLQTSDRAGARNALEEASRRAPREAAVLAAWIDYWLTERSPDYKKAQAELEKLPAESPLRKRMSAAVEAQRALFLFRRGERAGALVAADRARRGDLPHRTAYELGQIYMDAGRYDAAADCYVRAWDALNEESTYRDAAAAALMLKAYRGLVTTDLPGARRAVDAALAFEPALIHCGAAPLRGEIEMVRRAAHKDLRLLAVLAVAGDPGRAEELASRLLDEELADADRLLVYRLRALVRTFASHNFKGAEDDLRQVLASAADDVWARYRLAQAWTLSGVGWLRTAEEHNLKARKKEGKELVERAVAELTGLIADAPDFYLARVQRGEANMILDDVLAAKADYEALRDRGVARKENLLKEATLHRLTYVRGGQRINLDAALRLLTAAMQIDPVYFDALFELGNVYHLLYDRQEETSRERKSSFNRAIFWYRRAMAINPRLKPPRVEWARICLKAAREAAAAGQVRAAHELVERVEAEASDVATTHKERVRLNMRGDFLKATGLSPDAIFTSAARALAEVDKLTPEDPELPALRALYHRKRGWSFYLTWAKLEDGPRKEQARMLAVAEWKKAFVAWPDDPENGRVRDRLREIAPDLIIIDQERAKAAYERGRKAYAAKLWLDAAAAFHEALILFPESIDIRFSYAISLVRAGHWELARPQLERVANHVEGERHPEALYELGNYYLIKGERLVALPWFERYCKTMVDSGRGSDPMVERARRKVRELKGG